jgi:hypothetical protein
LRLHHGGETIEEGKTLKDYLATAGANGQTTAKIFVLKNNKFFSDISHHNCLGISSSQ